MAVLEEIIRAADLHKYVGLKRTQVKELVDAGELPPPIKLSESGRAKGWLKSEVEAWQTLRIAVSRGYTVSINNEGLRVIDLGHIPGETCAERHDRTRRIADALDTVGQ